MIQVFYEQLNYELLQESEAYGVIYYRILINIWSLIIQIYQECIVWVRIGLDHNEVLDI